jgi:molybdenum cofactor cytidylyltransferase
MKIATLILAAGQSSRMGQPKQLLKLGEKTLIQKSIETALAATSKNIYCVIGANASEILKHIKHYPLRIIENPNYKNGLSTSIKVGVTNIEQDDMEAVLIHLADQPKITNSHLNDLIGLFLKNPKKPVATAYQNSVGVPAIFPKTYFQNLKTLTGDKGAKPLLKELSKSINCIPFSELRDIDTPEDYKDLLDSELDI